VEGNIGFALLLTTGAGLATGIGGVIGILVKNPGQRFMGFTLGFSAGVMIHVSFVELLPGAIDGLGFLGAHIVFFAGMGGIFVIDMLVPHNYIGQQDHTEAQGKLMRTGMLVAFGMAIHNFPEGLATFAGSMMSDKLGISIAAAIAVHNIPEGMAVAAPIYAATGNRKKAFTWSLLSGLSEPVGAGLAALVLFPFLSEGLLGVFLAFVAGIMVAISLDELVPAAKSFETEHAPILGVILGAMVMALSLYLLGA
jgi:ZIP family zinc transporter